MTDSSTLRNPRLQALVEQASDNDAEARRVAGDLSAEQLRWRPPEGGWGVGDCLEHLVASADTYRSRTAPAITRARAGGDNAHFGGWGGTIGGRLLLFGVRSSMRLPAPRKLRPPPEPPADALERFLRGQREVVELMRSADGLDLGRIRFGSPVNALVRLNLGEAFEVLQVHAARHLAQARRVRERDGFPSV
jgi:hypothetical protein